MNKKRKLITRNKLNFYQFYQRETERISPRPIWVFLSSFIYDLCRDHHIKT